jgi:chaperone modulatory protein CbpM
MVERGMFSTQMAIAIEVLETWINAGWLRPEQGHDAHRLSEIDLARARLIRDLEDGVGVNPEGVAVILDLVDQIHGLRRAVGHLLAAVHAQPDAVQQRIVADVRRPARRRIRSG